MQFRILGTYVQTELGHGSNVRGIETTATYDANRKEFVINSPTLTSTKWWPGGLGLTATHCVLYARLILPSGEDKGIHGFFMQLRSVINHSPMPGVSLGDLGPKAGYNSMDNGFAKFDMVRIPRSYMLAGLAGVEPDGRYWQKTGDV